MVPNDGSCDVELQAPYIDPDLEGAAAAYSWSRSLEAYLLWLFGYVLFPNSRGNTVDRVLMPYARDIADAPDNNVPIWSWGSAVLAATYRGLCDASVKTGGVDPILTGCPLLLQLWSYERIAVGRPRVTVIPYGPEFYGPDFAGQMDDNGPTMASHWICRPVRIRGLFASHVHRDGYIFYATRHCRETGHISRVGACTRSS
jgi:Plant mobile domain